MPKLPSVTDLSADLIALPSVSREGNAAVSERIEDFFKTHGFETKRLEYRDENDVLKVSLVAKRGEGTGGIGFFSHSDTVPGSDAWAAFSPEVKSGKLYGRGACDMKGPLAATMLAAASVNAASLKKPVYVVVAADEETGFGGAKQVAAEGFGAGYPDLGVVAEPSLLTPIYSHKGGYWVTVTARGVAAHASTDKGTSANFVVAPFLAEMAELKQRFLAEPQFQDADFEPPTNGFNAVISDGNSAVNVTAAKTVVTLSFRTMPGADNEAAVALIRSRAEQHGLAVEVRGYAPFVVAQDSEIVSLALAATGKEKAITVPYGTEALVYGEHLPLVILGPGDIAQAHTVGEFVEVAQLERAVDVYSEMIRRHCVS